MSSSDRNTDREMDQIAVVGMAGRFPRAATLDDFWKNLCDGVASVSFYSDEELSAAGVHPAFLEDPSYVFLTALPIGIVRWVPPPVGEQVLLPRAAEPITS